jgi:hypothetical protein
MAFHDGWNVYMPHHFIYVVSGQMVAQVYRTDGAIGPWAIWKSEPLMTEEDLETACALAVVLYRLGE